MDRKKYPVTNIGTALILVVFIILAMVTFATLSIVSVNNDYRFTEKVAERTTAFYQSSNLAEEKLAEIDGILKNCYYSDGTNYFTEVQSALSVDTDLRCDFTLDKPHVSYTVTLDENWILSIVLEITEPDKKNSTFYSILSWQEISTTDWEGDDKLQLM